MHLAVSNIGWRETEDGSIAPLLLEAGATALEVAPGRLFPAPATASVAHAKDAAALWSDRGLPIVSMQALLFGQSHLSLFPRTGAPDPFKQYLKHIIDRAAQLGCTAMVFGSPGTRRRGEMSFDAAVQKAAPVFREIGAHADASGTVFCIEANAEAYGCDFATNLAEAAEVVARAASPGIGMMVDTGNMMLSDETTTDILPHAQKIRHLHLSAPGLGPIVPHRAFIEDVIRMLLAEGYAGHVTIEMKPSEADDPLADLLAATSMVREILTLQGV